MPEDAQIDPGPWPGPDHPAVHRETLGGAASAGAVMLRHPDLPFVRTVDRGADLETALKAVASEYLNLVADRLKGGAALRHPLDEPSGFGWLDVTWGGPQGNLDPRLSFWITRPGEPIGDATLVLLAGNRHREEDGSQCCEGGAVGARLALQVSRPGPDGRVAVRVTSVTVSGLADARDPTAARPVTLSRDGMNTVREAAARRFGFDPGRTVIHGAVVEGLSLQLSGVAVRDDGGSERLCAWSTEEPLTAPARPRRPGRHWLMLQVSGAAPASAAADPSPDELAEATDDEAVLTQARQRLEALQPRPARGRTGGAAPRRGTAPATATLGWEVIRPSLPGAAQGGPAAVTGFPASKRDAELHDIACAHAFLRGDELFRRLDEWGLPPQTYFKFARLPLRLLPRAGFRYAPDGMTVNAVVQPTGPGQSFDDAFDAAARPQLEVRFGVAATSRGESMPARDRNRRRVEYRSLAASRRWAWHEYGHVLLFAATGELEFRFAHSAGDALAAILADPQQRWHDGDEPARGATFGGSRVPRRHDRPSRLGWCWCGVRNGLRHQGGRAAPRLFGGYFQEQLMSSSLFRLYRAAGGDTFGDPRRRRAAAEYVACLIARAIALLGPATVVPAATPDQFVTALIDADIGTGGWGARHRGRGKAGGAGAGALLERAGGTLHKVIRWAFEAQGLYAADDPKQVVEGPGSPPPVDLFIPGSGAREDGGYTPMALMPSRDGDEPPAWHAGDAAIRLEDGRLRVRVGNRGRERAEDVDLWIWTRPSASGSAWMPWVMRRRLQPAIDAGTTATVEIDAGSLRGTHEVLVMVGGRGDLANLDPATGLPCAGASPPSGADALIDLVANDNNLALRRLDFG